MKKRMALAIFLVIGLFSMSALADVFNYVKADAFKQWMESGKPMVLVDIQTKSDYPLHYFKNSVETNAYPVDTDEQRKMLDSAVSTAKKAGTDVVVICPRGGGGAKKAYDYLKAQGVAEEKLYILEGGVEKWPYKEMLQSR